MASIRKRGDRWQAQVRRLGFPLQSKSFVSKKDVEVWARQAERKVDLGDLPADLSILSSTKLSDLVRRYRDEITPRKKGADAERYVLNGFLRHRICRKTLNQLMPSDFAEYRDERLLEVSSATLRRQLNPINNMFEVAKDEWCIYCSSRRRLVPLSAHGRAPHLYEFGRAGTIRFAAASFFRN